MRSLPGRAAIVLAPLVVGSAALLVCGPIGQDPSYHQFADQRIALGIPHAGDVLSNLVFLAAGGLGLAFLAGRHSDRAFRDGRERLPYFLFFAGVLLTAPGSTWYHLAPDTQRLFWDRLPMTAAFLGLFTAVIAERVSVAIASRLLWPLVGAGVASVVYWRMTEQAGRGDLRPYALVQYYPIAAIALLLLLYPPRYTHAGAYWGVGAAYALAKGFELADKPILDTTKFVSGHTLKHIAAGTAAALVLWMLARRRALAEPSATRPRLEP